MRCRRKFGNVGFAVVRVDDGNQLVNIVDRSILGITMSQLTRLIRHQRHAFALVNDGREAIGLTKLRS